MNRDMESLVYKLLPCNLVEVVLEWLSENKDPQDVFQEERLKHWAICSMSVEEFQKLKEEL